MLETGIRIIPWQQLFEDAFFEVICSVVGTDDDAAGRLVSAQQAIGTRC